MSRTETATCADPPPPGGPLHFAPRWIARLTGRAVPACGEVPPGARVTDDFGVFLSEPSGTRCYPCEARAPDHDCRDRKAGIAVRRRLSGAVLARP